MKTMKASGALSMIDNCGCVLEWHNPIKAQIKHGCVFVYFFNDDHTEIHGFACDRSEIQKVYLNEEDITSWFKN